MASNRLTFSLRLQHDYLSDQFAANKPLILTMHGGGGNDALFIGADATLANDPFADERYWI